MSYDIELRIDTGGERFVAVTDSISPTYNLGPMFREALCCGISELRDKVARDTIGQLDFAITEMRRHPDRFKKLNPENGWGNYEGALKTLEWMAEQARLHPKASWGI